MKSWPDIHSPWGRQLRFEDHEFEAMMDEMRNRAGEECFTPGKGVDVDLVLLRAIGAEADYVNLPVGIMGRTVFKPDGAVTIEVSRELSDQAETDRVARRRLRTTLAHECGHVACHRGLFIHDTETYSLFADSQLSASSTQRPPIMCRPEGVGNVGYRGEWWEYQANRCMAALLLPKGMVVASTRKRIKEGGFDTAEDCVRRGHGENLIRQLADEYDVSHAAMLYRLQDLGFIPSGTQTSMQLTE